MNISITLNSRLFINLKKKIDSINLSYVAVALSIVLSAGAIIWSLQHDVIIAYGDAESHLNIAKRVVSSITPGAAQLGAIWLPIPHILMIPFIIFDPFWRTGLAGSTVSGIAYIVAGIFLYKLTLLVCKNKWTAFVAFLVYATNPNILYMQSTPMTELPLIAFFMLSTYFFVRFLYNDKELLSLLFASLFGFFSVLSRYDGWFLVLFEAMTLALLYLPKKSTWKSMQGKLVLFCTLAFFGIFIWFLWNFLILGDPLYFTNSQFSAKTQQQAWLARGELPSYHNIISAFLYYFVTSMSNAGMLIFLAACGGFIIYCYSAKEYKKYLMMLVLLVPFIFNVVTLFIGQSVIFIPHLTPVSFEWRLFNVRYGTMMVPIAAFFFAFMFYKAKLAGKMILIFLFIFQFALFGIGYSKVITYEDGTVGLSHAKRPDAEAWIRDHYDSGLVLMDDYARTISQIRTQIPMQDFIYIGNKPYWEESLQQPEKYARWIIMQRDDDVWKNIYEKPEARGRLYKYFQKVYTSKEILIFKNENKIEITSPIRASLSRQ